MTISLEKATPPIPAVVAEVDKVSVDQIPEPRKTAFDRITAHREGTKQPVLVPWLRDPEERTPILVWAAGYSWHIFLFHLVRVPIYQWRLTWRAPIGLWRVLVGLINGLSDAEARPLRQSAVARDDVKDYLQLARERNARIRHRGRLISRATVPLHLAPILRQEAVEIALRAVPNLMKKDAAIEFPDPIIKDGPGYLARVNLPHGVTPADVMGKRPALASGLRRPLGCVWPAPGPAHGGQLDLWVGDQDLATARQAPFPLLERGTADLFRPLPYGSNQRNGKVGVPLIENNVLIGAMVGQGKTSAMRVLGLGASLDVTSEIHVHELKGSGDLASLEGVAHAYGSGQDDETIRACLEDLRGVKADIERRASVIKKIAKATPALCPNNKVTRELANRRDLGLHPVVVLLDEVQNLYSHEVYGKEAVKVALDIIRLGRAFGVILIQARQRPDADSLPKGISANAGIRIALRIMDDYANNAILGAGMYAAGVRATDFTTRDKGVAWLVGIGDEPVVAKSYNLTSGMAEKIGDRARQLREQHDRLTGAAAGLVVAAREERAAGHDLLADIRRVMAEQGAGWMWTQHAAAALAVYDRGAYEDLAAEVLGKMLGARGVRTGQINRADPHDGTRRNWQGFELTQIVEAMDGRPA